METETINPWLNPWSSRAQLQAQQTQGSCAPSGCPHFPPGAAPTPAAARGYPQHRTEILAPASVADGDKDKTTPSLINKGPDSAASIRQAIPEPARPKPATKRLHAGIAAGIRQPARRTGSGKHGALLAPPFTWGCVNPSSAGGARQSKGSSGKWDPRLGTVSKTHAQGKIKDQPPPPVPHSRPCSKQRQTWA